MRAVVATVNAKDADLVIEQYSLNPKIVIEYKLFNNNQLTIVYREKTTQELLTENYYKTLRRLEQWKKALIDIVQKVDKQRAYSYARKNYKKDWDQCLLDYALRSKKVDEDTKKSYLVYLERLKSYY